MLNNGDLFQRLRLGNQDTQELDSNFPAYPLNSPGMPLPGIAFIDAAVAMGDSPPTINKDPIRGKYLEDYGVNLNYLYRRALYDDQFTLPVKLKNTTKIVKLVPGHIYGESTTDMSGGPRSADVMILGKEPSSEDVGNSRNFSSVAAQELFKALDAAGAESEKYNYYLDNIVHWSKVDPQATQLPVAHKKDCAILLHQTLRLVRPKYILCVGSDASKWLLGNPKFGVNSMLGRVEKLRIPIHVQGEDPDYHEIMVMATNHPAQVYRNPELYPEFAKQVESFVKLTKGEQINSEELFINHKNVYKQRELRSIVDSIRNDPDPARRIIAVDGEWEGEYPGNEGAYLRTIQFSTQHGEGITVVLRDQGGEPVFKPSIASAKEELLRLLKTDEDADYYPRIGGHFLRADMPWLIDFGIDVRDEYAPPKQLKDCRDRGGWDTGLMYHAVNEATSYRLTDMTVSLTNVPVYDDLLKDHIVNYCKENDIKSDALEGYGFLPSWILHPEDYEPEGKKNYASYDADVTRRIAIKHLSPGGLLDSDWNGNNSWEPFWRAHMASLGVLEMEMAGICVDKDRVDQLTTRFIYIKDTLIENFRQKINWPDFNPESTQQCVAFLFGNKYGYKIDTKTKEKVYILPEGATTLDLEPIKTTGKPPKVWADVVANGEQDLYSPSTDKEVLGIMGQTHPLAMQLRDIKFISQILKKMLRPPIMDKDGITPLRDETGNLVYAKCLASDTQDDGKLHTHISQNKETGRFSCSRPPLQNISKRRESDYARISGVWDHDSDGNPVYSGSYPDIFPEPMYLAPVRTILKASPGCVLLESDYVGAELAGIAWLSQDAQMIEHVRRNILPESHPDHYDIHSNTAVNTFNLTCPPTKKGLSKAGYKSLRVAAKNVAFGIPYGRSARAIARQCKEEGVDISEHDCEKIIAGYFESYPKTAPFLAECRSRTQNEQWVAGSFGRMRRFIKSRDRTVIGEQERQGQNFPIQNMVADAVSLAISNFYDYRKECSDVMYKLMLQLHDAILFEVPIPHLKYFIQNVLHKCMVTNVPVWPRYLDNTPMPVDSPYHFGIDYEVQINWGEDITEEQAKELQIDLDILD